MYETHRCATSSLRMSGYRSARCSYGRRHGKAASRCVWAGVGRWARPTRRSSAAVVPVLQASCLGAALPWRACRRAALPLQASSVLRSPHLPLATNRLAEGCCLVYQLHVGTGKGEGEGHGVRRELLSPARPGCEDVRRVCEMHERSPPAAGAACVWGAAVGRASPPGSVVRPPARAGALAATHCRQAAPRRPAPRT